MHLIPKETEERRGIHCCSWIANVVLWLSSSFNLRKLSCWMQSYLSIESPQLSEYDDDVRDDHINLESGIETKP